MELGCESLTKYLGVHILGVDSTLSTFTIARNANIHCVGLVLLVLDFYIGWNLFLFMLEIINSILSLGVLGITSIVLISVGSCVMLSRWVILVLEYIRDN